ELQVAAAAGGAARVQRHPAVRAARREGPRSQQVLQDRRRHRPLHPRRRLGPDEEGSRAAGRDERAGRDPGRSAAGRPRLKKRTKDEGQSTKEETKTAEPSCLFLLLSFALCTSYFVLMPMSPYPVICYRPGCGRPALYKIAARWSDGVT